MININREFTDLNEVEEYLNELKYEQKVIEKRKREEKERLYNEMVESAKHLSETLNTYKVERDNFIKNFSKVDGYNRFSTFPDLEYGEVDKKADDIDVKNANNDNKNSVSDEKVTSEKNKINKNNEIDDESNIGIQPKWSDNKKREEFRRLCNEDEILNFFYNLFG